MLRSALRLVLLCLSMSLAATGCSQMGRLDQVMQQGGRAAEEIQRALDVRPAINVELKAQDDTEFIHVNVQIPSAPPGMSVEEVRKKVNIIVRKHIPDATQVTITF